MFQKPFKNQVIGADKKDEFNVESYFRAVTDFDKLPNHGMT